MAMICISGGKECDGCCECLEDDLLTCRWCGYEISDEEYLKYSGKCGDCYQDGI